MFPLAESILQVGDRLEVFCPEAPELCIVRSVGPDGTIDLPTLDPVPAVARTPAQVQAAIRAALIADARPGRVVVRFIGLGGDVAVTGAVSRGLRVFAPRGVDRQRLLRAATPTTDADLTLLPPATRLAPGTSLFVSSTSVERRISVVGAVAMPTTLSPSTGLLLAAALRNAGGLTPHADPNAMVVVRNGEEIPVSLPEDEAFRLVPGDVVRVGLVADRRYVNVRGLVVRPGSVEYAPGMTLRQALAAAGGPLPAARTGTVVWQTGSKSNRLSLAFLLDRRIPDPVLGPSDTLVVEAKRP